jgi:tRNA(Arg) A34 adenosine deaminase TadA
VDKRSKRFITLALRESLLSSYRRVQIGAEIVDGSYVVARAANQATSHPRQFHANNRAGRLAPAHACHAEIHALVRSKGYDLTNCEIFVARFDRNGNLAMCRPCPACQGALQDAGIKNVTYTTESGITTELL